MSHLLQIRKIAMTSNQEKNQAAFHKMKGELSKRYPSGHFVAFNEGQIVADAAKETGKPLSICGETASNPGYLKRILDIGIKQFSVSPRHISAVRTKYKELKKK